MQNPARHDRWNPGMNAFVRITLASIWLYQGLIPKLLCLHADELELMSDASVPAAWCAFVLNILGLAEIGMAAWLLFAWRSRWPLAITIILMAVATLDVVIASPRFLTTAFNPVTMNFAIAGLAAVGWRMAPHVGRPGFSKRQFVC